ncbi:TATA box-binding protein-associated factor RNA polymerase I subunit B [Trifolium repens]|nr:TATA box-binding protein-associated factor RNA polymerase I subunit B [Trifolium repens]
MEDVLTLTCQFCNYVGEVVELDGFYYCSCCGERNLDVVNTGAKEGEGIGVGGIYLAKHKRQYVSSPSSTPEDFGSKGVNFDDYIKQIRLRYVMGLQIMIELQCEALVKEFKVTLLICGLVGPIRLRLISKAGVFDDDWADKEFYDSHLQKEACHIAKEAIMPSDMIKWAREGKLLDFSGFVELERKMGHPTIACPISSSYMFRPQRALLVHKLESHASSLAQFIGLQLPPVNFYALAYRCLKKLSLPVEKILPYACRIYEWSISPDLLSLSKDYFRLPTHVCVVSVLIVAIRILYNINARSTGLLKHLHAIYIEIADTHEYSKDWPTYLKYCKDGVFVGLEPSYAHEEQNMMENLWKHYQNEENTKPSEPGKQHGTSFNRQLLTNSHDDSSFESLAEAIRKLKLDMEENRFCYIAPSVKKKQVDYVHYVRKKDKGGLSYVAHADNYILLRAFARVAYDNDIRILHIGVLNLERRLAWLEKRIDQCLHLKPSNVSCQFCSVGATENRPADGS